MNSRALEFQDLGLEITTLQVSVCLYVYPVVNTAAQQMWLIYILLLLFWKVQMEVLGSRKPNMHFTGLSLQVYETKYSRLSNLVTSVKIQRNTHHTHAHPFNGPFSGTTRVSRYQKGKTNLDCTEARDSEWQWHQLGHMQVCVSLQTDSHASTPPLKFFTRRMPFWPPNQQCQSTESTKDTEKMNTYIPDEGKKCDAEGGQLKRGPCPLPRQRSVEHCRFAFDMARVSAGALWRQHLEALLQPVVLLDYVT